MDGLLLFLSQTSIQSLNLLTCQFQLAFIFDKSSVAVLKLQNSPSHFLYFSLVVADDCFIVGDLLVCFDFVLFSDVYFCLL